MELKPKDIAILRRIITGDAFELLRIVGNTLVAKWNATSVDEETSFLTYKKFLERQERKNGIELFLKAIQEIANER